MGWPYQFVTLDDDGKHLRRQLLNRYSLVAQVSVAVPLLVVQIYFLGVWLHTRMRHRNDTPSSPVHKSRKGKSGIESSIVSLRKALWWCGTDCVLFGSLVGTRGELLGALAWATWLLVLTFLQTGDDYLHLTKRFGIVAASQLPFHYLLAIKTPHSPLQYLTHASHETLNSIHQILGRIVTMFILAHVALYLNFYVQSGLLTVKLQEAYVLCGVAAIVFFVLIGTTSLQAVRRASYRVFLAIHIVLSIAVLPLLFFHVYHIRIYVYETFAILLLNIIFRGLAARSYATASITLVPDTQMLDITVPLQSKSTEAMRWLPGQHAYLSLPDRPVKAAITKNPFTLSSIPVIDDCLRFVARIQSGNTATLASAASSGKTVHQLLVEGPYGVPTHADRLLEFDRVLLIAGGVGGTFIMPLYRQLLSDLSPSKGSHRRQKVSAVWIARSSADVLWSLPQDEVERVGCLERLQVFLTRSAEAGQDDIQHGKTGKTEPEDDGIELEERTNLLTKENVMPDHIDSVQLPTYVGRPNVAQLVDQTFSSGSDERVAVMVCGPAALGRSVRREVGRWVYKGRDVWFWAEQFSM